MTKSNKNILSPGDGTPLVTVQLYKFRRELAALLVQLDFYSDKKMRAQVWRTWSASPHHFGRK